MTETDKMIEQLWTDIDVTKGHDGFTWSQPIDDFHSEGYAAMYLVNGLTLATKIDRRSFLNATDAQQVIVEKLAEQLVVINRRIVDRYADYADNGFEKMVDTRDRQAAFDQTAEHEIWYNSMTDEERAKFHKRYERRV